MIQNKNDVFVKIIKEMKQICGMEWNGIECYEK